MTENNEAIAATDPPTLGHVQAPQFRMDPEKRKRMMQLAETLAEAVDSKRRTMGTVEKMQRAKQAAQGDADAARLKWREKLRDGDGTITREVQKLRVAERSALSLVEEYEVLEAEVTTGLAALELQAADAAADCVSATGAAVREAADQAYAEALKQAGEALALAFNLYCTAENANQTFNSKHSIDGLSKAFFDRLGNDVWHSYPSEQVKDQVKVYMDLPPIDLQGVDIALVNSPTRRMQLRQKIKAESVE